MGTIRDLILARQDDPNTAILFEDESWTYVDYVAAVVTRCSEGRRARVGSIQAP